MYGDCIGVGYGKKDENRLEKVEYDGHSFRLIINDEAALLERLKKRQAEIIRDIEREQSVGDGVLDEAAKSAKEVTL